MNIYAFLDLVIFFSVLSTCALLGNNLLNYSGGSMDKGKLNIF